MISRRRFVSGIGAALVAPLAADAQQAGKVWRIGLFHVGVDHVPPSLESLRQGLKELGYEEGKNIRLDWRNLPDEDAARKTATEFLRDRTDLIVAFENQTVRAAYAATSEVPIVFLHVTDPVADGMVMSFAHPGRNLTGIADTDLDLVAKQLEIFKECLPHLRRLLVLIDPHDPATRRLLTNARQAAATLRVQLLEREVTTGVDIERVFGAVKQRDVQAVFIVSPNLLTKFPSLIIRLASQNHLPVSSRRKEWVAQGALFSYGYNFVSVGRRAAIYVDKILKGARPGDLPVEQPTRFEFVVNVQTAKALGLTIPPSLLLRADQVIE